MSAKGIGWHALRVLGAGCATLVVGASALAQQAVPPPLPPSGAEIDPNAPLDAMPDLGVDWPDLASPVPAPAPESAPLPPLTGEVAEPEPRLDAVLVDDGVSARRYSVTLAGIDAVAGGDVVTSEFDKQ